MRAIISIVVSFLGLLNIFGFIVAAIWLAILGEWSFIFAGVIASLIAPFGLGLLVLPGMIFGRPAAFLMEKGWAILAIPLAVLSLLYTHLLVTAWCLLVFLFTIGRLTTDNFWPLLLLSYAVAQGPWSYLAQHDARAGNSNSTITVFFAQLAYVVTVGGGIIFGLPVIGLVFTFGAVMLTSVVFQTVIMLMLASENEWQNVGMARHY